MGWQTRPIFVSSTFVDMQAERDHLRLHVFAELEERLKTRRCHLEWVDLRVGVATAEIGQAEARELHVLKVCLGEVKRCRPFLIVLLGDRYGWVPPPERLAAALSEEGFEGSVEGRSVTDLEISFGALANEAQHARSFVYFRDPLPYADMPREIAALYSEAHATDPGASNRQQRLEGLKQQIEQKLPGRARRYTAEWSGQHQAVIGLEAWGRQVLDDIWSELDSETASFSNSGELSWQQEERQALDDYIETCARDFVGRHADIEKALELLLGPKVCERWALCLTGGPGSGKSAVICEVLRRLRARDVVVLAHARDASPRSASADAMLWRWIEELSVTADTRHGLPENAEMEEVDATFRMLLHEVAERHRVVIAIDAADGLVSTRGTGLTWLPQTVPENVRLFVTAAPGEASTGFEHRRDVKVEPLSLMTAENAGAIAQTITARYHRKLEPAVLGALLAKRDGSEALGSIGIPGAPAWNNPLWLAIAVEQLNLLDSDDFARATQLHPELPADHRIRQMMIDLVAEMPFDIEDLCTANFQRAERYYRQIGPHPMFAVRAFVGFLAVSRGGWREADFRDLMPRLSGEPWDELKFAHLRRLFRGYLRQHGSCGQWDFAHEQMRSAARRFIEAQGVSPAELHAEIAAHLLSLDRTDPLRQTETMVHVIGSEDWAAAVSYLGDLRLGETELESASAALATDITRAERTDYSHVAARKILDTIVDGVEDAETVLVVDRLLGLDRYLMSALSLSELKKFYGSILHALKEISTAAPENATRQSHAMALLNKIGAVDLKLGKLEEAHGSYLEAVTIAKRLHDAEPKVAAWRRAIADFHRSTGDVLQARDQPEPARQSFRAAFAAACALGDEQPNDWAVNHDIIATSQRIARVSLSMGDTNVALHAANLGFDLAQSFAEALPGNPGARQDLALAHEQLGDVALSMSDIKSAHAHFTEAHALRERLIASDPRNLSWLSDLASSFGKLAESLAELDDFPAVIEKLELALSIRARLSKRDPDNIRWTEDLAQAFMRLGDALGQTGELDAAYGPYSKCHELTRKLISLQPNVERHEKRFERAGQAIAAIERGGFGPQVMRVSGFAGRLSFLPILRRIQSGLMEGNELLSAGKSEDSIWKYQDVIAAANEWLVFEPTDARVIRDALAAQSRIGEARYKMGDLTDARDALVYCTNEALKLARSEPEDPGHYEFALVTQIRLGTVFYAMNDLDKAREAFENVQRAAERRAAAEPSASRWWQVITMARDRLDALA